MFFKNSKINPLNLFTFSSLLQLSKLFKVSFIIGSQMVFFSATNIVAPMVGILGGLHYGILIGIFQFLLKFMVGVTFIPFIGYHIPQIFASAYWLSDSKIFKISIPLICFFLFIVNPVGSQAWQYACLWSIPVIIALFDFKNIFLKALGSTFVAHSIGSIIYLYAIKLTPQIWLSLIPIALLERIIFALGMTIIYCSYHFVKQYVKQKQFNFNLLKIKFSL